VDYFVQRGYTRDVNIRAAPYDYRLGTSKLIRFVTLTPVSLNKACGPNRYTHYNPCPAYRIVNGELVELVYSSLVVCLHDRQFILILMFLTLLPNRQLKLHHYDNLCKAVILARQCSTRATAKLLASFHVISNAYYVLTVALKLTTYTNFCRTT
jgi:hypothetical protein